MWQALSACSNMPWSNSKSQHVPCAMPSCGFATQPTKADFGETIYVQELRRELDTASYLGYLQILSADSTASPQFQSDSLHTCTHARTQAGAPEWHALSVFSVAFLLCRERVFENNQTRLVHVCEQTERGWIFSSELSRTIRHISSPSGDMPKACFASLSSPRPGVCRRLRD